MTLLVSEKPNNFDAIRLAMALLVVWSHSFALYFGSEVSEPVSRATNGVVNSGEVAVDVFFVVSGFLISQSFERSRSWVTYLRKRVTRIYPAYFVATSLCAFVLLPAIAGTKYTLPLVVKTLGLNLLLRNWFVDPAPFAANPVAALNGSLWSIPIEFWCYIGVLAFGLLRLRRYLLPVVFTVVLAADAWTVTTGKVWGGGLLNTIFGWPNFWFRMAPFFIGGMIAYQHRDRLRRSAMVAVSGLLVFLACAWLIPVIARELLPAVLTYAVLFLAFSRQPVAIARHGDFSYGTYLYAYPIQQLLVAFVKPAFPLFVGYSLALSVLAGIASWFAVERWFHKPREPHAIPAAAIQPAAVA